MVLNKILALNSFEDMSERLEIAARTSTGAIIEIGGGEGINTLLFLKTGKFVIVVDPFEFIEGSDESYFTPYSYDSFIETTKSHGGNLTVIKLPSQHPEVYIKLKDKKPIGLIFIDGLQDTLSVLSDLRLAEALNAEVICVDDYNRLTRSSQVPLAVTEFLKETKYGFVDIGKREAYFVRQ